MVYPKEIQQNVEGLSLYQNVHKESEPWGYFAKKVSTFSKLGAEYVIYPGLSSL
jgi:hypothetical protein